MSKFFDLQTYLEARAIPEPNCGCWIWLGKITNKGYSAGNGHRRAYRLSGKVLIPGLELDHLCRVRCCINPDHLEQVTRAENIARSPLTNQNKTHCKRGHSLEGCYITKAGTRFCRHCVNERKKERRAYYSAQRQKWRNANREKDNATQRRSYAARKAKRCQTQPI